MKSRRQKISILFVPEGEGRSRNITLSRGTIRFLLICFVVFLIFILAGSVSYFLLSVKASRYDMTVVENLKLIEENRRIVKLAQDLEKLKTFNRQIRKVMGVPLNLDSTVIDTVISEFNSDNIWQTQNFFGLNEPVFSIPVEGVVSRGYSVGIYPRITHQGTDFACKEGNIVTARRIKKLGFVGEVKTVNTKYIRYLMAKKIIPVIAPVAYDNKKRTLNINADNVAVALACALKADNLIFMTDVPGVLDKDKKVIPSIKINRIKELIKDKVVTEGMIPKLNSCYKAIKKGVKKVIITNAENGLLKSYGTTIG